LQSHYSQPIDYSGEILEEKKRAYWRLQNLYAQIIDSTNSTLSSELDKELSAELRERFDAAMQDDFNTPEAMAALFGAARQAGREISERLEVRHEFLELKKAFDELMGQILGFDLGRDQTVFLPFIDDTQGAVPLGAKEIQERLMRREQARQEKDYALADQLRDEIQAEGWAIEDTPEGPVLRPG